MPVITECTLRVSIGELQRAITAVVCHAEKAKQGDEQPLLCRVRVIAGKDHLVVTASDGRTSGVAWVPILADDRQAKWKPEDGPFVVDLYPKQARQIAAAMTPIRDEGNDFGDATLHLTTDNVTITDVSGKYPDTATTVPTIEQEATMTMEGTDHLGYPDLVANLGASFARAAGAYKPLQPPPGSGARFEVAAREYGAKLVFEPVGDATDRAWLVWLRDAPFVGFLLQAHEDDAEIRRRASERVQHLRRLGVLKPEQEAHLQLGGDLDERGEPVALQTAGEDDDGFYDPDNDPDAPRTTARRTTPMATTEATGAHSHGELHDAVLALVGDKRFLLVVDDEHEDGLCGSSGTA